MAKRKGLALAPVKRALKGTGANLAANDATEYVKNLVDDEIKATTTTAKNIVGLAKKTKITSAFVEEAIKMRCNTWSPDVISSGKKRKDIGLALAPVRGLMKEVGADLVAEDAVIVMANYAKDLITEIGRKALQLARHAKREKIMIADVKAARDMLFK